MARLINDECINAGPTNAGRVFADRSVRATWFDQFAENGVTGFEIMLQAKHGCGDVARVRTREANYANSAAACERGDGDDGVVEIHDKILRLTSQSCGTHDSRVTRSSNPFSSPFAGPSSRRPVCNPWDRRPRNGAGLRLRFRCAGRPSRASPDAQCGVRATT